MLRSKIYLLVVWGALLSTGAQAETKVTTYVIKKQEERENTRWTLTEWLRIKERMKMMDVWIAMFSNPDKDKFTPELNLIHGIHQGTFSQNLDDKTSASEGVFYKGQLWLTNIVSSTFGVRTLNIDFGGEGMLKQTNSSSGESSTLANFSGHRPSWQYGTANFRIFGKNIQDSSLIIKYGQYRQNKYFSYTSVADLPAKLTGQVLGGEMSLYLFKWLGLEGNYLAFGDQKGVGSKADRQGTYYDYMAYIEISLLRLMGGLYQETWNIPVNGATYKSTEKGVIAGLKLQF